MEEVDQLDEKDIPEITDYLQGMGKTDIYHLGLALGLSDDRVRPISEAKTGSAPYWEIQEKEAIYHT